MVQQFNWVSIRTVLDRLLRHPMLQDVTLEAVVQYTVDFIQIAGCPMQYIDKDAEVEIKDYRSKLPCDLIQINMIKDCKSHHMLRSATDYFDNNHIKHNDHDDLVFKVQGMVLVTNIKEGKVIVSYKSIPIDKDGFPLIPDHPAFLTALESYIKMKYFEVLFDLGKIQAGIYQNTQQQYYWNVGRYQSQFTLPSISEMESITNMLNTLIPMNNQFKQGFKHLGDKELIINHR